MIGSRVYGFDSRGDRTREREYGTAAQASALGNDWTRSRVAGFNADGGLVRYAVYDKKNDNSLDTSLYAYGRDALGKKNFGAHGRIASTGDTSWTISRRYTWDGDWVVADSTEVGRRYYAYLGHRRIAEVAEDISGKWTSRAVLTDHLGTVTGIVGDSGNVEAAYLLDPYGNLEHYAGTYQTLYLLTGKEHVSELAGYEFGARVYDPVMGMWWGRDKAAQFWSPYGSGNNPVNAIDPDGMETFQVAVFAKDFENVSKTDLETRIRSEMSPEVLKDFAVQFFTPAQTKEMSSFLEAGTVNMLMTHGLGDENAYFSIDEMVNGGGWNMQTSLPLNIDDPGHMLYLAQCHSVQTADVLKSGGMQNVTGLSSQSWSFETFLSFGSALFTRDAYYMNQEASGD